MGNQQKTTDAEVVFSGSISSFSTTSLGGLRWTDSDNFYQALIDGSNLVIQKKVNGSLTKLSSMTFAATAGTVYSLRFSVVGTTLSAKVWPTGTSEPRPSSWMVTVTDSSLSSRYCGLRMFL